LRLGPSLNYSLQLKILKPVSEVFKMKNKNRKVKDWPEELVKITDPRIIYDGAPAPDEDPADYIRRPISAVKLG